jgi:hypothetical protein
MQLIDGGGRRIGATLALTITQPDDRLTGRPQLRVLRDRDFAGAPVPFQKRSTQGRSSTSQVQALRGWRITCR